EAEFASKIESNGGTRQGVQSIQGTARATPADPDCPLVQRAFHRVDGWQRTRNSGCLSRPRAARRAVFLVSVSKHGAAAMATAGRLARGRTPLAFCHCLVLRHQR